MRQNEFITLARNEARKIWTAVNELKGLQREWNALDYGNTMQDGEGVNEGVAAAHVGSVVFATADAIEDLLDAGHATNLSRLL